MGNCGAKEAPQKKTKMTAAQQAKVNEATNVVEAQVAADVERAAAELKAEMEAEEAARKKEEEDAKKKEKKEDKKGEAEERAPSETSSEARERRRQAEARYKKAHRRLNKLETLRRARDVGALSNDDFNAAVRRLHSATGNDPTNPQNLHALPEGFAWFTTMLEVMWPSVQAYCKNYVEEWLQPLINRLCNKYSVTCEIEHFDLGSNTPNFGPIEARYCTGLHGEPPSAKKAVEIALGINIRSNMKFFMKTSVGQLGVQNYNFRGTLYFWLRPFLDTSPFVGAVEMAFVNPPVLDLDWTGIAEGPFEETFRKQSRYYIDYYIDYYSVLPNNYVYIMAPTHPLVDASLLKAPRPEGILRICVQHVKNMPAPASSIPGVPGKYKPYVEVKVGSMKYRTPVAEDAKYPRWTGQNATHDFLVYHRDQWALFALKDGDEDGDDADAGAVIGQVTDVAVNRLAKRRTAALPLTSKGFPITDAACNPTTISVTATWMAIDADTAANDDCVALLKVSEVQGIPTSLHERAPFKVAAQYPGMETTKSETRAGVMKAGAAMEPMEVLKQIREQADVPVAQICKTLDLKMAGDVKLVEQALDKTLGGEYTLRQGNEAGPKYWWMKKPYLLDYLAYPEDPEGSKWAATEQGSNQWPHPPQLDPAETERRVAYYKVFEEFDKWCAAIIATQQKCKATSNPFFGAILAVKTNVVDNAAPLRVALLDKDNKEVASSAMAVSDDALGDEPDAVGPFPLEFTEECGGGACNIIGDISIRTLKEAARLPENWNLAANEIQPVKAFVEWWKQDQYVESWVNWVHWAREDLKDNVFENLAEKVTGNEDDKDEECDTADLLHYVEAGKLDPAKFAWLAEDWSQGKTGLAALDVLKQRHQFYLDGNEGQDAVGVDDDQEAALSDCLKAGALTWNDYDTILARLRGEDDGAASASIAETMEWMNMLVTAMWPGINEYTVRLLKQTVGPQLQAKAQSYLSGMKVKFADSITLGKVPPSYGTIQAKKVMVSDAADAAPQEYCELLLQGMAFESEIDVGVDVTFGTTISVGVQDLLFRGDLLVRLGPMVPHMPLIGAVQYVLPNPPELDLTLTGGIGELIEKAKHAIPSLDSMAKESIVQGCAAACAIPNYLVYPMVKGLDVTHLRYPSPKGILRVECKQALHLVAADANIRGVSTSSDAYVQVRVGSTVRKTKPITSLAPEWTKDHDNVMDFIVYSEDQVVDIELFDADVIGADDTLGAVYQKIPVLGGGYDDIRRGLPVRSLRRMGTAVLPLQEKVVDTTLTGKRTKHAIYELKDIVGKDGLGSVVVVATTWIAADQQGDSNRAFIASATVNSIRGLSVKHNGPYTVRFRVRGQEETTRVGQAGDEPLPGPRELVEQIQRFKASTDPVITTSRIARVLGLTEKLVVQAMDWDLQQMDALDVQLMAGTPIMAGSQRSGSGYKHSPTLRLLEVQKWYMQCKTAIALKRQLQKPVFNQKLHVHFAAPPEAIAAGERWMTNAHVEILDKKGAIVGAHTFQLSAKLGVAGEFPVGLKDGSACYLDCALSLSGLKAKKFDPLAMSEEEEILGLEPFTGPEIVDTPNGPKPKIGMFVCARNLRVRTELNWKVAAKKPGLMVKRGDRPGPEGKVVAWTSDNTRAVVDFGTLHGEWRVKPGNLCLAPPPLPPPPPPQVLYVVCEEMFAIEGQFDLAAKEARGQAMWCRVDEDDDACAICVDEAGRWVVTFDGMACLRSVQAAHGRYPHMMGHTIEAEFEGEEDVVPPKVRWERQDVLAEKWFADAEAAITITKPIARVHEEVLEEMEEQIVDDIMEDLQADLYDDLIADLEEDLGDEVRADIEQEMQDELADDVVDAVEIDDVEIEGAAAEDDDAAAAAEAEREAAEAAAAEEERARQEAEEEAERQRAEEEAERQRAEEAASRQRAAEEETARKAEQARQKADAEAKRKAEEEKTAAEKKKREEEEEKKRREAEEKKKKEEEEKKRKEAEEKKKKEEEEKKRKEAEERRKREEAERKRREEEERRKKKELLRKQAEAKRLKEEQARKARKAAKRKGKMESLNKALELGALTKMDHLAALRRLQSVTGDDPTNGDRAYTLPETMQWLNTFLEVLWPNVEDMLSAKLEDVCVNAFDSVDGDVSIDDVDLGRECPAFGPISAKYIDEDTPNMSVEVGLGITYNAGVTVKFQVGTHGQTVIRRMKVVGTMYFWLRPSMRPPFIGCVQMAFVNPPTVKFVFADQKQKGIKIKQMEQVVQRAVEAAVQKKLVVPNYVTVPVADSGLTSYPPPAPQGVVQITVVRANHLEAADEGMTSDPYVSVRIGAETGRTSTVYKTLSPDWASEERAANAFNMVVHAPDQWILIDVFDEDDDKVDDHLGSVVGLPVNRLVLRCLDPANKAGTVDIPLTRGGQPVQGEEGDVSTVTVKAEWLTIDSSQCDNDAEALLSVTLDRVTGVPERFVGPFKVRASCPCEANLGHTPTTSRSTSQMTSTENPVGVLRQIKHLQADKKTVRQIAFSVGLSPTLVTQAMGHRAVEGLEDSAMDAGWLNECGRYLAARGQDNLHLRDLLHLTVPAQGWSGDVKLELLDSSGEALGFCRTKVDDSAEGDEPDAVGPFSIALNESGSEVVEIHGHIVRDALRRAGVPKSWNLKSKKHKAMGDERKKKENQATIDANAGGKLTTVKEEALSDCLQAGALTWGDYDILIGKLRGESAVTSIAETLEWVNMILNPLWERARPLLENYIRGDLNDMLKETVAGMTSMVTVDITGADLGKAEPSFSTINVEKLTCPSTNALTGVALMLNNLAYRSNIDVELSVGGVSVQIQDVKLAATVRCELGALSTEAPFFGTARVYCPNPPSENDLSISAAGGFTFGGLLKRAATDVVQSALCQAIVTPNAINCSTLPGVPPPSVNEPAGVLRLGVVRARHLLAMDAANFVRAEGSDSYVHLMVGSQIRKTKTITSLNPEWLETFDLIVHDMNQCLDLEIFDEDMANEDDSMGALFQKETVLGGGTDLITRGMPINALTRKSWNTEDRKRPYVVLPLEEKVVDEELTVKDAPYEGARVKYNGEGKFEGTVTLDDGAELKVGDEGVVEAIDKTTTPFHTFHCHFASCGEAALTAQDLDVKEPLYVYKAQQVKGTDGEASVVHVHPEWLSRRNTGKEAARLLVVNLLRIEGMPALAERDLGAPYSVKFTGEVASEPAEKWPTVTSNPGKPEYAKDRVLETLAAQMIAMKKDQGKTNEEIAAAMEITPELAREGLEIFDVAPLPPRKVAGAKKTITVAPCAHESFGRTTAFVVIGDDHEDEVTADGYLREALGIPAGHALNLYRPREERYGKKLDKVRLRLGAVQDGETILYDKVLSHAAMVWDKRARDHTDKLRAAVAPAFHDTFHLVVPDVKSPSLKIQILDGKQNAASPLGEARLTPAGDGSYPAGPVEVVVKSEAGGGMWGWGKTEGYEYTPNVHLTVSYVPLFMQS